MCISAAVLAAGSLVLSGIGTISAINNARYQKALAKQQYLDEADRLQEQRSLAVLQAKEAEIQRQKDYMEHRESNLAAIAASGVGQNLSFKSRDEADMENLRMDLGNIRLQMLGTEQRFADQIKANLYQWDSQRRAANGAIKGAVLGFVQSGIQAGSMIGAYGTPSSGGSAGKSPFTGGDIAWDKASTPPGFPSMYGG